MSCRDRTPQPLFLVRKSCNLILHEQDQEFKFNVYMLNEIKQQNTDPTYCGGIDFGLLYALGSSTEITTHWILLPTPVAPLKTLTWDSSKL